MSNFVRCAIVVLAAALCAADAGAQQTPAQQIPRWLSKLSVHGYVAQAYAVSSDHQIFGIPTGGTTDYRDLALQFRYDQDAKNIFVVQFRQERLGDSPVTQVNDDVELDWAFYQRNFSDNFSLKAGRIPLPLGIFNEAQGAGTTFPFYRPSSEFYEGEYSSKSIEGVLTSFNFDLPKNWGFDADAYYGQWKVYQRASQSEQDAKNAYGTQLWLRTPVDGLRFGTGAYRCTVNQYVPLATGTDADYLMIHGSVEGDFDRWLFATEYLHGDLDGAGSYDTYYGQAGVYLSRKLSVHARAAIANLEVDHPETYAYRATVSRDFGLALNYAIHPALLLKLEGHTNEGLLRDDLPQNIYAAPAKTRYMIASIAATF